MNFSCFRLSARVVSISYPTFSLENEKCGYAVGFGSNECSTLDFRGLILIDPWIRLVFIRAGKASFTARSLIFCEMEVAKKLSCCFFLTLVIENIIC